MMFVFRAHHTFFKTLAFFYNFLSTQERPDPSCLNNTCLLNEQMMTTMMKIV